MSKLYTKRSADCRQKSARWRAWRAHSGSGVRTHPPRVIVSEARKTTDRATRNLRTFGGWVRSLFNRKT